jgi:hypothetical protein
MLDLDAAEEDTILKIRPEGAIIIETHTANWRIKPAVENGLTRFAESTYGPVAPKKYREEADYLEWASPVGERKIVAAIDGSLVVVGNSKRAVRNCLETRWGRKPPLRSDPALNTMRARVGASAGLTFGYISASNATRLLSWSAPVLFGRGPGDATLEQILTNRAAKVLGAIAWTSRPASGGIEDRFLFALEPPMVSRLQPVFKVGEASGSLWQVLPIELDSLSIYKSEDPARAWEALRAASGQLDILSSVLFGSLLKASLLPYGIEDPEAFLNAVRPEIATLKLRQGTGGSVLFARTGDRQALEQMFKGPAVESPGLQNTSMRYTDVSGKRFATAFLNDYFVIGAPDDLRICLAARNDGGTLGSRNRLRTLSLPESSSGIVSYVKDDERVRGFFTAIASLRRDVASSTAPSKELNSLSEQSAELPYATTETNLVDEGIERRTVSALGQFSTLLTLFRRE